MAAAAEPGEGDVRRVYGAALASSDRATRLRALDALEFLNCERRFAPVTKLALAELAVADFHLKHVVERRTVARFLDAWFAAEALPAFSRRLAGLRMEEVDTEVRDSLLPAVHATAATATLADTIANPPSDIARDGYALLVVLDALFHRLGRERHPDDVLDRCIAALRRARAVRNTEVVKPFLWQVEVVLERACARRGIPVPGALRS